MVFSVSERVLDMLEWGTLEAALAEETVTPGGRRLALTPHWAPDAEVEERLEEVSEARAFLESDAHPLLGGNKEIDPHLAQAAKGKILGGVELLAVAETLRAARVIREALTRQRAEAPRLAALAEIIPDLSELEHALLDSLDHRGQILDSASPALAEARREVAHLTSRIQKQIAAALTSPLFAPYLQDQFYTLRGDRYVLPIKIEARARVRGIVHDVSASGTTVFVEPEEIVDLNNHLRYAELAQERESIRILRLLTARVGENIAPIRTALDVMSRLDLILAGARISDRLGATRPQFTPEARLELLQARHPILALRRENVVPNDIRLGRPYKALIVSGPNAGGKTVALKTAGLFVLMMRAGLHVPALEGSTIGGFGRLHADIGDDQNLAEALSTFSGQIAQVKRFLERCDDKTLVLLDEIIVGTDPTEGAALAQAILERLVDRGACLIVTTHYPGLKELAAHDHRFENASMEIDPRTHNVTYRLIPGVAGRSGALDIAEHLGLDAEVVDRAKALLGSDRRELEQRLRRLDELRLELETEKREAVQTRVEGEQARRTWVEKLRQIDQARVQISREMKSALDAEIKRAHSEIAAVIRDLQRKGTAQQAGAGRRRIVRLEERLDRNVLQAPAPSPPLDWSRVSPGDRVRIPRLGTDAELLSKPGTSGQVQVRVGGKRMVIPATDIREAPSGEPESLPRPAPTRPTGSDRTADEIQSSTNTLDVRGLRAEEAESKLIYFLDKLYAAGEASAYLIHGHGTGALKTALRAYLATSPYVAGHRPADAHKGGDGVTIITLRQ
jgi:DNA mismatch repair protein MutS2